MHRLSPFTQALLFPLSGPYPNEDHFLFFSQPESVLSDVAHWLAAVEE